VVEVDKSLHAILGDVIVDQAAEVGQPDHFGLVVRDLHQHRGLPGTGRGHRGDIGIRDPRGADPYRVRVGGQPDVGNSGADRGVGGDPVGQCAAVAGAVAEHHVHLFGFVQAHGDPVGEQVADRHDLFARVLQRSHHAVADRPALGWSGWTARP